MVGDGLAERFSLVGVLQGGFVRALSDAQGLSGDADSTVVQGVHGDGEPVANAFDGVFNRNLAVVEHQGARV